MNQEEAVRQISSALKQDAAVRAVFLKGSMAREENDAYSDVDMYCMVDEEEISDFLQRRLAIMTCYQPLIYWSEANFVGPQIVGVYEDGLHFDLYTVTPSSLQRTDRIKVLYDPDQLLAAYQAEDYSMSDREVLDILSEFTFSLLEFEAAFQRRDLLWASRLASHLAADLSLVLRHLYDPGKAALGTKSLHRALDPGILQRLLDAVNHTSPDRLPLGVQQLADLADELVASLPETAKASWNHRFFDFMHQKVRELK
ncbi:DNA polymerase III subunit beta [Paenibacillus sp. CAA11]|uniref:nucleotidyltransferase domain-containing protein n=1 Tax=Paenibacillus sp. CAA11 TaxID=1532905 RepID=UPI000D39E1F5|nr:nucleotidyltransferase domain-containing protein [Paenibacillus sp. CAA11]AWB44115.1 DNA polymerase III subunit beta [Paenibacillus sp. CAA11]